MTVYVDKPNWYQRLREAYLALTGKYTLRDAYDQGKLIGVRDGVREEYARRRASSAG